MSKWHWRSMSMIPTLNTNQENSKIHIWCKFGDCIIMRTNQISQKCDSKWPKSHRRSMWMTSISIPAESIPGCMLDTNLVIPAQICEELSCGQGKVYGRTDRRTSTGSNNTPLKEQGVKYIGIPIIRARLVYGNARKMWLCAENSQCSQDIHRFRNQKIQKVKMRIYARASNAHKLTRR